MPRILGVDPGLASTGYGIIHVDAGRYRWIDHGVISTETGDQPGRRLQVIADGIRAVLRDARPDIAGVESLYFTKNVTSAIPVAQARGVVLLVLEEFGIPAAEFTPQVIKQSVVGTGQAEKEQVGQMVRIILGLTEVPRPDHAADALAAAITRFTHAEAAGVQ